MLSPFLCIFFAVAIAFAWTTHSPEERNLSLLIANACRGSLQPEFLELVREFSMVCEKLLRSVRVVILQSFLHRGKCHKIASPLWIDSISFTTPRRDPRESLIHSCMYSPLAVKGVFLGSIASFFLLNISIFLFFRSLGDGKGEDTRHYRHPPVLCDTPSWLSPEWNIGLDLDIEAPIYWVSRHDAAAYIAIGINIPL